MFQAARKYRTFMGGMLMYAFLLPCVAYVIRQLPDSNWVVLLAILPVVPIAYTLSTSIRYPDRFAREQGRPLLQPGNFALLCTFFLVLAIGLLEALDLLDLPWILVPVFMLIFWSLGMFLAQWRVRKSG